MNFEAPYFSKAREQYASKFINTIFQQRKSWYRLVDPSAVIAGVSEASPRTAYRRTSRGATASLDGSDTNRQNSSPSISSTATSADSEFS